MITEDYVSFETAKLLKEKGFDEPCRFIYDAGYFCSIASRDCRWNEGYGELIEELPNSEFSGIDNRVSAPTLQMAMKWLREVHKIEVRVIYNNNKSSWYGACNPMGEFSQILLGFDCKRNSYEEACEEAIKYCLENLI